MACERLNDEAWPLMPTNSEIRSDGPQHDFARKRSC